MNQNKKGTLMFTIMVLLVSLMCGAQVVKATDGDLNETDGILLKDTNSNGKIDEVHITVDYTGTAADIKYADKEATIGKFTVSYGETDSLVATIKSIEFVSDGDAIAVFKLVLDEEDEDLKHDTSGTAFNISYDATNSDLEIIGSASVSVATIESDVEEKDGAQPIILTAVDQIGTSLDVGVDIPVDANIIVTFSEPMDISTLDTNNEWLISPDPKSWSDPAWSNDGKTLTLQHDVAADFILGETEIVTLTAPLAVSGVTEEDRELQDNPDDSAVNNPFTFTIVDETDDDNEGEEEITPPEGSVPGPTTPNVRSGVTLYRMPGDPRVYVIKNKKKHWIKTPKEFENSGYKWNEIQEISAELLEKYPEAEDLVSDLLRAVGDYKVYKIKDGKKHWIKTIKEFENSGYKWNKIQEVSAETLASYQNAILSDLLRAVGDYKVYKIKDGKKHWIKTVKEFNAAGYNWKDVEEVPAQDLDDYSDSDLEDI